LNGYLNKMQSITKLECQFIIDTIKELAPDREEDTEEVLLLLEEIRDEGERVDEPVHIQSQRYSQGS